MKNANQKPETGNWKLEVGSLARVLLVLVFGFCSLVSAPRAARAQLDSAAFSGADAGAKIAACIAALPSTGGTCDARGLQGAQSAASDFLSGVTVPVTINLGDVRLTTAELIFPTGITVNLIGAGHGRTVLIPAASNQRLISMAGPGAVDGARIGGFTLKAHASGSTTEAMNLAGWRASDFFDIELQSNGTGNFSRGFVLSSYANGGFQPCYGNVLERFWLEAQTAPVSKSFISFENSGKGWASNANVNFIRDLFAYGNSGSFTIIDARRSALTTIDGGLMESNSSATGIIPGTQTSIKHIWFESNGTNIAPGAGADGSSNQVLFLGNYVSGGNLAIDLTGFGGWSAITNTGGVTQAFTFNNCPSCEVQDGSIVRLPFSGASSTPSLTHGTAAILGTTDGLTDMAITMDSNSPFATSIQHRHHSLDGASYPIALNPRGGDVGIGTTSPQATLDTAGQDRRLPINFSALTACSGTIEGETAAVKDSTTNTWGATITGLGGNHVLAYCDGTNWTVAAK